MAEDVEVGRLAIPVVADMGPINRQIDRDLKQRMRQAGETTGAEFTGGFSSGLRGISTAIKALVGLQVVQIVGRTLGQFTGYLRESANAAIEVTQSYLRLSSASKLYGVDQQTLNDLSRRGRVEMNLSASAANELATNAAKIAGRAGEAARAQELWAAALDLGAANGLKANEVAMALDQSFRGMDEGLNRLGLSDPGQLFKEWADSAGRTVESMTDAEKQMAILTAITAAGAKVQGEYGRQLEGDVGKLNDWQMQMQRAREEIGDALLPVIVKLTQTLEGPLSTGVRLVTSLLEGMLTPTERLARQMERLGMASELVLPLTLQDRIKDTKREIAELEEEVGDLTSTRNARNRGYAGLSGSGLAARRRELLADGARAAARGDQLQAQAMTFAVAKIDEVIAKQRELSEANRNLTATEREYQNAAQRRDLRMELNTVNDRIEAISSETVLTVALVTELNNLYATREKLEGQLGVNQPTAPAPDAPKAPALTAAEKRRADAEKKRLDDARARLVEQAGRIREEMQDALAGLTATMVDEAMLQLDRLEEKAREVFKELKQEVPAEFTAGIAQRREAVRDSGRLQGRRDQLQGLEDRGHLSEFRRLKQALMEERDALAANSALRADYNALIRQTGAAYDRAAKEGDDARKKTREAEEKAKKDAEDAAKRATEEAGRAEDERIQNLREMARTIEENARGALQLASAFGVVDENVARALENVVQLGTSIARIAGGDFSAIPAAIGSLASLISGLGGNDDEEAFQAHAENLTATYRLVRALDELRGAVLTDMSPNERDALQNQGEGFFAERGEWLKGIRDFARTNPDQGSGKASWTMSQEELNFFTRLEEAIPSIDFFDPEKMQIDTEALFEAWEKFLSMDVGSFGEDLQGRLDAWDFASRMGGKSLGDATAQMEMFIATLMKLPDAKDFATEFQRVLKEGGVEAARAWLEKQAIAFAQSGQDALPWAADLEPEEVERILGSAGALDVFTDSLNKATDSLSNVPELFDLALRKRQSAMAAPESGPIPGWDAPTDIGGGGSIPVDVPLLAAVQSLPANFSASLAASLDALALTPWAPADIAAILQNTGKGDTAPVVRELERLRAAVAAMPAGGDVIFEPGAIVVPGGANPRETAEATRRVLVDALKRDAETKLAARQAVSARGL